MNNKAQFTPGPWIVETTDTLPGECADNVHRLCYPGYRIRGVCVIWNRHEVSTANAHLIAAAPAMYEALKRIKVLMESGDIEGRDWVEYGRIINALAQAEGRQG